MTESGVGAVVRVEEDGPVATMTLCRGPVNAINGEFHAQVTRALHALMASDAAVLVIKGEGRGFSAGADIKEFAGRPYDPVSMVERLSAGTKFWEAVYDVQIPVIAAMHGFAIGAGLVLSALCDLRVASESCVMSMPEIAVGISVAGGGAQLRRLGLREGFIRELLLGGRTVSAAEALAEGLVDRVLPDEGFEAAAAKWAQEIASHGRDALIAMKTALNLTESVMDWRTGYALTRSLSVSFVEAGSGHASKEPELAKGA